MKIIKSEKDIEDLKFGDQYRIDTGFPEDPSDFEALDKALAKEKKIQDKIEEKFKNE